MESRADRLLQTSVFLFCLVLFPVFIIYTSLTRLTELKIDNQRQNRIRELTQTLETLEKYSSNRQYFHHLFKQIFKSAAESNHPLEFLRVNKENLSRQYPDCFEFIVWDKNGRIIKELTDQQGYKFILTKLYEVLQEIKTSLDEDLNTKISDLPLFAKNKNLIGKFIGRFFIPEHLKMPYLHGLEAGPAKVDFSLTRSEYWFHASSKITFFVFFNRKILDGHSGLEKIIRALREDGTNILINFVPGSAIDKATIRSDLDSELKLALARYEDFDRSIIETERAIFAIRNAGKDLRIFAVWPKLSRHWSLSERRNSVLIPILALLLLTYLLTYFVFYRMQHFFSIKLKLALVFLFASIIPLIILGYIGYDFIASKSVSLKNEFITKSYQTLAGFDLKFEDIIEESKVRLLQVCDSINKKQAEADLSRNDFKPLFDIIAGLNPSEAYLISSESQKIYDFFPNNIRPEHSNSYIVPMISASLKFINGILVKADSADYFNALLSPSHSEMVRHARKNSGQINDVNTGNSVKTAFQYAFGIPGKTPYNYYLMMLWDKKNLYRQYLNRNFSSLQKRLAESQTYIRSANGTEFWPKQKSIPRPILEFLDKVEASTQSIFKNIEINGVRFLAIGIKGQRMGNMILANVIPEQKLEQKTKELKIFLILAIILNLFFTIAISFLLSNQLMKPINELQKATIAIGQHNFRYRIPELDNDEIGYLGTIFNRVIEGLGDLEVAKIVQESLFPGNHFRAGPYRIYGRSIVMTTLGGDYYDCYPIDEKHWGLIIGDVAGHGVSAGLMMAMAKAGVITSSLEEKLDPSLLTAALHRMFFAIKNTKMKRMMTFQYYLLDQESEEVQFTNAGHCFPLLVDSTTQTASFIEHVATPLGIGPRARYSNAGFRIENGQALILYTDGLAEAKNSEGEEFGYERMQRTLPALYDEDPEIFYQKILSLYESWTVDAQDDLTIILCVREKNHD